MNTTKETQEMYLKVIYKLSRRKGSVRSADVAAERGYARSTVSYAMKSLRAKGLVTVTADGEIRLTEEGRERTEKVNRRYAVFTEMLELRCRLQDGAYRTGRRVPAYRAEICGGGNA